MDDGRVGGVLLFASNFNGPAGLASLTDRLQTVATSACLDHPILVMLDQEGGQVTRVQAAFAPPSQLVAGSGGADYVRDLERASAAGLHQLGVGLDLAPVTDVRTNGGDQIILDRSFGSNPAIVSPLVGAAVQGLHDGGGGGDPETLPRAWRSGRRPARRDSNRLRNGGPVAAHPDAGVPGGDRGRS